MEIHGCDIVIEHGGANPPIELVVDVIKGFWPDAVVEHLHDKHTSEYGEHFVFRDEAASRAWDEEGWTEENDKTLVHVLGSSRSKGELTVVIDDNKENLPIAEAIRKLVEERSLK